MQINHLHEDVTLLENTANVMTPIFVVKTPDKKNFKLEDGTILIMDLRDGNNDKISANSMFEIGGRKPTQKNRREIDPDKSYRPYHQIAVDKQYNTDNQGKLKVRVDPGFIDFIEGHIIEIALLSPDVVDWDNSILEFEIVEEAYREPLGGE